MKLQAPNGAVIDAAEGAVAQLKANGFKPLDEPKPAPKRRQPALPPEEQVKILKKQVVSLTLAVLILLGATVGLGWLAVKDWMEDRDDTPKPGQNYSSEVSNFPSEK